MECVLENAFKTQLDCPAAFNASDAPGDRLGRRLVNITLLCIEGSYICEHLATCDQGCIILWISLDTFWCSCYRVNSSEETKGKILNFVKPQNILYLGQSSPLKYWKGQNPLSSNGAFIDNCTRSLQTTLRWKIKFTDSVLWITEKSVGTRRLVFDKLVIPYWLASVLP